MDTLTLCGWSAFQWHRIPPLVRMLYLSAIEDDAPLADLLDPSAGPLLGGIDYPLRVLAPDINHKPHREGVAIPHLSGIASCQRPHRICRGLYVTDLPVTLLMLSRDLSVERMALACSELCGRYSVFKPSSDVQMLLDQIDRGDLSDFGDLAEDILLEQRHGWQQARDPSGRPTSLWKRPAMLSRRAIEDFISSLPSRTRGKNQLGKALGFMAENTASPLETMAAILLGQPRRRGGEGIGRPMCNLEIPLSSEARRIAGQGACYGDLCFRKQDGGLLDIECHSKTWHAGSLKTMSDMERATALECMGVEVLFLTDGQLKDSAQAAEIARVARKKLGISQPDPSVKLLTRRDALRREILVDWRTFT